MRSLWRCASSLDLVIAIPLLVNKQRAGATPPSQMRVQICPDGSLAPCVTSNNQVWRPRGTEAALVNGSGPAFSSLNTASTANTPTTPR